jgi:hypothetical protein
MPLTLAQQLRKAKAEIARLTAELERLRPKRDPWQDRLEAILARHDLTHRWTARELLDELRVPERDVDNDTYRRLSRVMQAIGGWRHSNNVADGIQLGRRVRGYVRAKDI